MTGEAHDPHDLLVRLRAPRGVREIAEQLERAGFETWCVGGAIRDAILRHPSLDWDLATAATPTEMRRVFRRTVPKGEAFGTLGVFDAYGVMHEVTTFRRDVRTDGRHAEVEFGASLDDDLARRDFTINAIAFSPTRHVVHDPFDGIGDLGRRVVRAVGEPHTRMREDRLRALRAIRFAGRFGFAIEPATWAAIVDSAPHLTRLSPERVREELEKTMRQVAQPSAALEQWRASGALAVLVPALAAERELVFATMDHLPLPGSGPRSAVRLWLRLAAPWLERPRAEVEAALRALRSANQEIRWIAAVVDGWQAIGAALRDALAAPGGPRDADLRRWAARVGRTALASVLRVASARFAAERAAGRPAPAPEAVRSAYRRALRIAYRDPIEVADLAVSGRDLLKAGIAAGPGLGIILQRLVDLVVEEPRANQRDRLLAEAVALAAGASDAPGDAPTTQPSEP